MNIKKINQILQYWHNNTEIPNKTKLILIEPKNIDKIFQQFPIYIASKNKNIYFVGKLYNSNFDLINIYIDHDNDYEKNYMVITYNLDTFKLSLNTGYNNWNMFVNKWIYLSDIIQLLKDTKYYHNSFSDIPKQDKLILFEIIDKLQSFKSFNENLWCIGALQLERTNDLIYKLPVFNITSNKHLIHMYAVTHQQLDNANQCIKNWIYLDDIKEFFE